MKNDCVKIALWSGPRNISTALMYSFANRSDTAVVDEPLFGYFLKQTGVWRPSRDEALATMETDPNKVIHSLLEPSTDMPVYFMKHMANQLIDLDLAFLNHFKNVILIRDPRDVLLSYSKQVEEPTVLDTAYKMQADLIDHFNEVGTPFTVLNAKNILLDPEGQIRVLCDKLDIQFQSSMLSWDAGPREEDGVWAKYWYQSVHESTGFGSYRKKDEELPSNLSPLYDECMEYYVKLEQLQLTTHGEV
jgi:hypothetical protein